MTVILAQTLQIQLMYIMRQRVLFGHMDGTAAGIRGGAQKPWADYVREDLQSAGLSLNW